MATAVQNAHNTDLPLIHMNYGGPTRGGQRLTISNRQVSSVSFYLKRDTALGPVPATGGFVTIYSLADVALATATITNAEIQALSNSAYTLFTKSITPTVINEEVRMAVGMNVDTSWNVGSCVDLAYQNTDDKASEYLTQYGSSWANNTTMDCAYQYAYTEVITTQSVTAISGTTATGNGTLNTITGATDHGHCWKVYVSAASPPTTANSKTTNGVPAATGAFTSAITGLTAGTKYGVRAYVIISGTTFYGNQVFFWAAKGTVAPFDAVTRVNTYTRSFWAGEDGQHGVGQMVIQTGGVYSTFIPPVGARQPVSAFPQPEVPRHKTFKEYSNAELTAALGLNYATYAQWVNQMGPFNLQKVYGHVPTYEEYVNMMVAQFRAGAK